MDIKRTGPNNPAWAAPETVKAGAPKPMEAQADAAAPEGPGIDTAFQSIQASFNRADLHSEKWPSILKQSAEALVFKSTGKLGALPDADQKKIANLIAGDPILSNRIFRYLDRHLA